MTALNFNAQSVQPSTGQLDPVPAGWYDAAIDESERKPVKDNLQASFLEIRFNIISGQYQGRKLYTRLNLWNPNPTASEIAQKDLSAIAHAVNVLVVQDSAQLHGIPLKLKVKVRPAAPPYEATNDIAAYKPISFVPDAQPTVMAPGATAPQPGAMPWQQPGGAVAPTTWQQPQAPMQPPPMAAPAQPPAAPMMPWQQPQQPPVAPMQPPAAPAWAGAPAAVQQPWAQPPVHPAQQPMQPPAGTAPGAFPSAPPQQVPPWQQQPPQ